MELKAAFTEQLGLSVEHASIAAADVDDIAEEALRIQRLCATVSGAHNVDLEDFLVDLEIAVKHLTWHWHSVKTAAGLSDDDD